MAGVHRISLTPFRLNAISILNALVGNWGVTMFPSAGEAGGGLGSPPQPAYPRISAQRLDGVPWKYPFVPLKIGVFQQLRDSIVEEQPYKAHGWFISRQNPVLSLPDRQKTWKHSKDGFHRHHGHHHE
jgi:thiosulfate reductase/polysulfide reductase chain A